MQELTIDEQLAVAGGITENEQGGGCTDPIELLKELH